MDDKKARETIEEKDTPSEKNNHLPTAGPHAKKHLTDKSKTPGAGSLPEEDDSVNPGSG